MTDYVTDTTSLCVSGEASVVIALPCACQITGVRSSVLMFTVYYHGVRAGAVTYTGCIGGAHSTGLQP